MQSNAQREDFQVPEKNNRDRQISELEIWLIRIVVLFSLIVTLCEICWKKLSPLIPLIRDLIQWALA